MKKILIVTVIFMLALAVRLAAVYMDESPLETDENEYDRLAVSMAAGNGYINSGDGTPTALRPPLYPAVLALIYMTFGHSIVAVKLIQAMAGAFMVVMLYGIAHRIFNPAVAFLTGIFSSFYMTFVVCTSLLYTETLSAFLIILITYLVIKIDTENIAASCCVGVLCGLLMLMRSSTFFIPILVVAAGITKAKAARRTFSRVLLGSVAMLLFFGLTLLPWTVRNYKVFGKGVFVSTNSGLNLYQGLMRSPERIFDLEPKSDVSVNADAIKDETERNAFFVEEALKIYKNRPLFALKMMLLRLLFFWNIIDWEILGGDIINYQYLFIFPFFIFGAIQSLQKRKDIFMPLGMILAFTSLALLFPGTPRYRMPVDGYIIIFASYGIYEFIMKRDRKMAAGTLVFAYWSLCFLIYLYSEPVKYAMKGLLRYLCLW